MYLTKDMPIYLNECCLKNFSNVLSMIGWISMPPRIQCNECKRYIYIVDKIDVPPTGVKYPEEKNND